MPIETSSRAGMLGRNPAMDNTASGASQRRPQRRLLWGTLNTFCYASENRIRPPQPRSISHSRVGRTFFQPVELHLDSTDLLVQLRGLERFRSLRAILSLEQVRDIFQQLPFPLAPLGRVHTEPLRDLRHSRRAGIP